MLISVITGLLAGSIHVIGGVDHLVSMAPTAIRDPKNAIKEGVAWGLGHSAGVLLLSIVAIFFKDWSHLERMSSMAEVFVGLSLLIVGVIAIRAAFGLNIHTHSHSHGQNKSHDHIHLHFRGSQKHNLHNHASTGLGVIHGLAGASHLLAVLPALALPPLAALAYIFAYLFGSIAAMSIFLSVISMAIFRAQKKLFPIMIGFAGGLSIVTGIFWLQKMSLEVI